ncbi:MAG: 16S rRNA (guanine(966)-N(2))-methyltransferase RsmD [Ignavibacteriae bacterium]|nr:16S rRNA (guanine(966)-N(2))-methyltransferase RsmD [Ignavibacteriota bacterium]NOG98043.1 16S rRNA (guanine(966)-N(2))-methyltransferase RsmD [Ignavibacteriota bacterium]
MRIISGFLKGRKVKFPQSKLVRPTTDRVKETLFNILNNQIDFEGITACDLYAGSGSLGLEMISRGADEVHFVEKNFQVYKVLQQNIADLEVEDYCKVLKIDAVKFTTISSHTKYNLILADPPFFKDDIHLVVDNLLKKDYLSENGMIIIERSIQTKEKDEEAFKIEAFKRIGDSLLYRITNA